MNLATTAALAAQLALAEKPVDRQHLDPKTAAGTDFYRYATGGWQDATQIPAEYSSYGGFSQVDERNELVLKELVEAAAKDKKAKGIRKRVGDFYAAGMDEAAIDALGITPIQADLDAIAKVEDVASLSRVLADFGRVGGPALFESYIDADDKDSSSYIVILQQAGLGLPDRDYYTRTDEKSVGLQAAYREHIAKSLQLLGDTPETATAQATAIYELEARLAKAHMTLVEQRDPQKVYNKMSQADLAAKAPGFPWLDALAGQGIPATQPVNVRQPGFFTELGKVVADVPMTTWRSWLRWHLVRATASYLPKAFADQAFAFYGKALTGAETIRPRWKRVLDQTDRALGEDLGQLYVAKAFPPEAKRRMLGLIDNLKVALRERIEGLPWMSDATKAKAKKKLDTLLVKVGYPDTWRNYDAVKVARNTYLANVRSAAAAEHARALAKLGKPVDKNEWFMSPPTVNAYNPTTNEIAFPAGILQPPFFFMNADDAVNYGAIGMVIGHELTHGYDDQGRQYDETGNLVDWWTPADAEAYTARTALMVKQYSAYEPLPGSAINGELTLGENIADLGGLKVAYAAFKKAQAAQEGQKGNTPEAARPEASAPGVRAAPGASSKATGKTDGFTPEQRFFLAYAQAWRNLTREAELRRRLATDPHSPARFRVNGPLANLPEFHAAFGCKAGDGMVRDEATRPQIW